MSYSSLLSDTCTVLLQTTGEDTSTGYYGSVSYASTADVPCTIQQNGTSEAIEFGKRTGRRTFTGFFEFGAGPMSPGDRVTWNSRTLECVGYPSDPSGKDHHYETVLAEPADE